MKNFICPNISNSFNKFCTINIYS